MAVRFSLAPSDGVFIDPPTWQLIDVTYTVQSVSIDRGRANEMSQTSTGSATVELVDQSGDFDPTNPTGAFYGLLAAGVPMGPCVQARIQLDNPNDSTVTTLFRGYISRLIWTPSQREDHANVTFELVDGLAILAACEMPADGTFGDGVDGGNIIFNADTALTAVQTRIGKVLGQLGWPASLRVPGAGGTVFSGNVALQQTVYAPRSTVLQVVLDAADGEFPQVANVYIGGPRNPGAVVFHGRYARFNPADVSYNIRTWQAGDDTAAAAATNVVRVSPPLVASLDDTNLYTSAYCTPADPYGLSDFSGQYVTDAAAVTLEGLRTWSAENLATGGGAGPTTAAQETKKMAGYVRDNFARPALRVGQLTVKSRQLSSRNGAATFDLLCNIDISDLVHLKTTHGGGGGFDTDFYTEGIHYQIRPAHSLLIPQIDLTLDVSPRSFYATPFPP
jgi:hypothetical protein